jgi:hypothetical protein
MEQKVSIQFKLPEDTSPAYPPEKAVFLGEDDDVLALEIAYSILPLVRFAPQLDGTDTLLIITQLSVKQVTNQGWWKAEATYTFDANTGTGGAGGFADQIQNPEPGAIALPYVKIGFSVGNRTARMTKSLDVIDWESGPGNDPIPNVTDWMRAIGATKDGVEGVDISSGGLSLQITAYYYPQAITFNFLGDLSNLIPSVNSQQFLAWQPGEVLLLGCDGQATVADIIPITFTVEVKKNITAETDLPFNPLTAEGHYYIDYRFLKTIDDDEDNPFPIIQTPAFRIIHKVHESKNFNILGFPTS